MAYWNIENPDKPWGKFDPKAQLDIPFDWSDWLADLALNYASHVVTAEPPLEVVGSAQTAGVITAFLKVTDGGTVSLNRKYWVECEITTDGNPPRKDNRRVYLKMVER
jgi:hypothetical protein